MKTLYLLRHADTESKDVTPDYERDLSPHGLLEAEQVGCQLKDEGIRPDYILSSHARRARQTAEIVAGHLGYPLDQIHIDKEIYYHDVDTLLGVLRETDDSHHAVMMAGHNPYITYLAHAFDADFEEQFPTCGVAAIEFPVNSWQQLAKGKGRVLKFWKPEAR